MWSMADWQGFCRIFLQFGPDFLFLRNILLVLRLTSPNDDAAANLLLLREDLSQHDGVGEQWNESKQE